MKPYLPFVLAACFAPAMAGAETPAAPPATVAAPRPPQAPDTPAPPVAPVPLPAPSPVATPFPEHDAFPFAHEFDIEMPHFPVDVSHLVDETARQIELARVEVAVAEAMADAQGVRLTARTAGSYEAGLDALQNGSYEEAIAIFARVISSGHERADAALYWKAFAEYRAGQSEAAGATLAQLRSGHPDSRYRMDAQILETELKQGAGQPVDPAAIENDEIKLLAIQGLRNSDRAVPLLRQVMASANNLNVKRRALYVLALNDTPGAEAVLTEYARGAGNPDLQVEAIRYFASRRGPADASPLLRQVYVETPDVVVKREVINAYLSAARRRARGEPVVVNAAAPATADLLALYRQETNTDLKRRMIVALAGRRDVASLVTLARSEQDAELRTTLVRYISGLADESPAAAAFLAEVLQ